MKETLIINWKLKHQAMYGCEDLEGARAYLKTFKETNTVKTAVYWDSKSNEKNLIKKPT